MRTANKTNPHDLIDAILAVIFTGAIGIESREYRKVYFDVMGIHPFDIRQRFVVVWDNRLNFSIYKIEKRGSLTLHPVDTEYWFRIARLIQERHLAAEALKK